jgi:hypothetical protein
MHAAGALLLAALAASGSGGPFQLTEAQVQRLRRAVVVWSPVESGAPALLPSLAVLDAEEPDVPEAAELTAALEAFLERGRLEPGRYTCRNPLAGHPMASRLLPPSAASTATQAEVAFTVTAEHLKLLRAQRWESLMVNPKRPYGDMSYFELDMAEVLGEPVVQDEDGQLPEGQVERLGRLHEETVAALQVFLQHAKLD